MIQKRKNLLSKMSYMIITSAISLTQFFIQVYGPALEKYIHIYMSSYTCM